MLTLWFQSESSLRLYANRLFTVPSILNVHTNNFPGTSAKLRQVVGPFPNGALRTKKKSRNREERHKPSRYLLEVLLVYAHTSFSMYALPIGIKHSLSLSLPLSTCQDMHVLVPYPCAARCYETLLYAAVAIYAHGSIDPWVCIYLRRIDEVFKSNRGPSNPKSGPYVREIC